MKVLYLVNAADAQSVPFELGMALRDALPSLRLAAFYANSDAPHVSDPKCLTLGAQSPLDRHAWRRLRAELRESPPDILHVHHFASTAFGLLASARIGHRPKLIKTEHNCHRHAPWHHSLASPLVFGAASAVIANSQSTLRSFNRLERLATRGRAIPLYNGVDLTRVRAAQAGQFRSSVPSIGTVGRLVPQKNHHRLLKAFAKARPSLPPGACLEIVGDGPLRSELEKAADALAIRSHVIFHGALSRDAVYRLFAQWHAFVMPSLFEGFCNALVEALAADLPCACSNSDTLKEVVGSAAVHFDPFNEDQIAATLIQLLKLERQPSASPVEKYDLKNAVNAHLALYRSVMQAGFPADKVTVTHQET